MPRRARTVLLALVLALALVAGCSAQGSDDASQFLPETTQPAATTSMSSSTTTTATAGPVGARDIADKTFPGHGDPEIDVLTEAVTVRADPGKPAITGHVAMTLRAKSKLTDFSLDLQGPKIDTITVDRRTATVQVRGDQVVVLAPRTIAMGHVAHIDIRYHGTPKAPNFPGLGTPVGWQADDAGGWFTMSEPYGTSTWVPANDHPSDKVVWTITLDTPAGVQGVSNGQLLSHETSKGRTLWRWSEREPMAPYLVLAAVGSYDIAQRPGPDGTRVLIATATSLKDETKDSFDQLDGILSFFSQTFGGRADDDAGGIVVDKELHLALETQTRPLFGSDSVGHGPIGALAHEIGHQWFGDEVTTATWPDLWLNEGFATYADWLYRDHAHVQAIDANARNTAEQYAPVGLTVRDPEAAGTFDMVVYERGALTLHALRKTVGDATFFRILRMWLSHFHGRSATTKDFVDIASHEAHRDLAPFFASWLDKTPQPELPS
jgi:aminopeptidase N